jgi:hypothetical protein
MCKQTEIDCESTNHYLTKDQLDALQLALAKEKKIFGTLDGYRFEKLLMFILPNCKRAVHLDPRRVTDTRDKRWFDLKQPYRGIEVKTYQTSTSRIMPKTIVRNVLKRIPPVALPDKLLTIHGEERQVKRDAEAGEVGSAILGYMKETLQQHAKEKGIPDRWDFAILFRNQQFTQVGYWEEPLDFGDPSDYYWKWKDRSLIGSQDDDVFFTWYFANQRQLFYRFRAPQDVQVFEIPDVKIHSLTEDELQRMLDDSYHKGYEDGIKRGK